MLFNKPQIWLDPVFKPSPHFSHLYFLLVLNVPSNIPICCLEKLVTTLLYIFLWQESYLIIITIVFRLAVQLYPDIYCWIFRCSVFLLLSECVFINILDQFWRKTCFSYLPILPIISINHQLQCTFHSFLNENISLDIGNFDR